MRDFIDLCSIRTTIFITYQERNERNEREREEKNEESIFSVHHQMTAMATGEHSIYFFKINRIHSCLFLLASFFFFRMFYTTTTTSITHLTRKKCFLRSMYESVLPNYECESLRKRGMMTRQTLNRKEKKQGGGGRKKEKDN
jgi:hypothetical protein